MDLKCDKSGSDRDAVKPIQERRSEMTTTNLMLVIKATNDASKALKSVEGQLERIVKTAANAACKAVTGGRSSRSFNSVTAGIHTF